MCVFMDVFARNPYSKNRNCGDCWRRRCDGNIDWQHAACLGKICKKLNSKIVENLIFSNCCLYEYEYALHFLEQYYEFYMYICIFFQF